MKGKRKNSETTKDNNLDNNHILCILAGLTIVGTFLRFYQLGFNSLWLDEISTFNYASGTLHQMWGMMATGTDYTPPLFFVFEKISLMIFGTGEWQMRFFPAIFGVLTIPVMYYIGKEFWNEQVGLIAAGFIAFSPFLIFYSQEARSYSLALLFCAIEFYFLLKATKQGITLNWILFGVFAGLALWTHFYTIVFTAILFGYVIIQAIKDTNILRLMQSGTTFLIVSLPIFYSLVILIPQRTSSAPTYGMQDVGLIIGTITQLTGYQGSSAIIYLLLCTIGIAILIMIAKTETRMLPLYLLVGTLLISIPVSHKIPMIPRYLIFLAIPLSLGVAMVSTAIPKTFAKKTIIATFLIAFFILAIPFYATNYTNYSKDDWRTIATELKVMTRAGDSIVTVPLYIDMPLKYYYDAGSDGTTIYGIMNVSNILALPSTNSTRWFIVTGDINAADPSGQSIAWLQENAEVIRNYGSVLVLRGK